MTKKKRSFLFYLSEISAPLNRIDAITTHKMRHGICPKRTRKKKRFVNDFYQNIVKIWVLFL